MQEERMHEREHMILSFVEDEHYRPMKIKEMAALMNVPKKQRGEFHEVLDRLIAKGKIAINRRGLVGLPEENIVVGEFMATQKGFGFVRVEGHKEDIFIPEPYCNHAFHGDLVKVLLKKSAGMSGRRPEGEVIQIVKRAIHTVVGTFQRKGKITFVLPDNLKWNQDIYIPKGATLEAENGHKVVVEITDYGDDKKSPEGYVTQILGRPSDPGVDIMSIVKGFGLPDSFSDEVMAQVAKIPLVVELSEIGGRVDLRNQDTVTIDGEDAKDLDDAITLNKTAEGEYELGVHIADVSHYVTEHSPLDKEALNRGTSVYLVDRVIPMLPFALSNGICSLNAGVDRLALSCMMTIDRNGAYRRCFFKPGKEKYVSKGKNLEQLINEAIESIDDGTDGMLRFFKFSTPKLYRFVGMLDEDADELNDYKAFGHMGVIDNNIKDFTFLETYNRHRITDRSYDMYFRTGYGAHIEFDYDPEIGRDDDKYFERTLNAIKQAGTTHGILVRE